MFIGMLHWLPRALSVQRNSGIQMVGIWRRVFSLAYNPSWGCKKSVFKQICYDPASNNNVWYISMISSSSAWKNRDDKRWFKPKVGQEVWTGLLFWRKTIPQIWNVSLLHIYYYTLLQKKCTLISPSSPVDPGSLTPTPCHVKCIKWSWEQYAKDPIRKFLTVLMHS